MTYGWLKKTSVLLTLISFLMIGAAMVPTAAHAGIFSDMIALFTRSAVAQENPKTQFGNVQTMTLPKPAMNIDPSPARGGGDVIIVDDSAVVPSEGPSGTMADIQKPKNGTISTYVVHEGDTLSAVATMFEVSANTILWANDLPKGTKLKVGQQLTILPVTGLKYTVKKSDTLALLAKRYGADADEIGNFNGIDTSLSLVVGDEIIIPDGEIAEAPKAVVIKAKVKFGPEPAHNVGPQGNESEIAYYIAPISHYIETQGIHGYNGVDLAAPSGTPLMASADGTVIVAKAGGWNGGYGSYIVIQHDNGSQTLYSHMSRVTVSEGQSVSQGQTIGAVGTTGKSTGPHLHFEIRNGIKNPF